MDEMVHSQLMSGMQGQKASESTSVWGHMRELCRGFETDFECPFQKLLNVNLDQQEEDCSSKSINN